MMSIGALCNLCPFASFQRSSFDQTSSATFFKDNSDQFMFRNSVTKFFDLYVSFLV